MGLGDYGRPAAYVERQIARWSKQYEASKFDEIPEMDRLIEWLPATLPEQTRTSVVHGDYRKQAHPRALHSVTNYECSKGLWSSLNDHNYFEIAYALQRQSGPCGLYAGQRLYTFADNHDVERAASRLGDPAHLPLLYALLFTMPGVPSIYYGSEWGLPGRKTPATDAPLRPALDLASIAARPSRPGRPAPDRLPCGSLPQCR